MRTPSSLRTIAPPDILLVSRRHAGGSELAELLDAEAPNTPQCPSMPLSTSLHQRALPSPAISALSHVHRPLARAQLTRSSRRQFAKHAHRPARHTRPGPIVHEHEQIVDRHFSFRMNQSAWMPPCRSITTSRGTAGQGPRRKFSVCHLSRYAAKRKQASSSSVGRDPTKPR
jgi:hypothetical protein